MGVVVLAVLWGPLAFGELPPATFLVTQGLTIVALGLWLVRIWVQRPFRLLWPPACWAVLVFLLYALVRCRLVLVEYPARVEMLQAVVYASLFFIVINNFTRRESAAIIAICLIALGLVLSWHAVYQFATKSPTVWGFPRREGYLNRGSATYMTPNHLAAFLGMMIPLALCYTLLSRFSPTMKVFFAYAALSMMAGVGVSLSRGGIIATSATMVVFCLLLLFQRGYWIPAVGIMAVIVALGMMFGSEFRSLQKRFDEGFRGGQVVDIRVYYWPPAAKIFEDHPLWGEGPGQFDSAFARYRPPQVQTRPEYVHNDYLNTLSDWGAAGTAIIAAVFALLYYGAWKTWSALRRAEIEATGTPQKSARSAFLMGASVGLLAILFHSVVDFNMHVPANAVITITLMALIAGHWRFVTERYWKETRALGKIVLTAIVMAAMVWLGEQGLHAGQEAFWLHRAADETASVSNRLTGLEKAYEAEPLDFANSYNLGEYYRLSSLEGNRGYEDEARQALQWYAKSMALNPLDAFVPMRCGMCLDWLGQNKQASTYFDLAEKLDPNNYHVAYYMGRHCVELDDLAGAKHWFNRSMEIYWTEMAAESLRNLEQRMADTRGLYK